MSKKIFINGRFLSQRITGVQRTAYELIRALDLLIEANAIDKSVEYIIIHPKLEKETIVLRNIRTIEKGRLKGNLWEQFELPFYTRGSMLVSLCMVSTLLKRNQIVIIHDASVFVNPQFFSFSFRTWYKAALTILGKLAKHILTVSEFSKSELIKHAKIKASKISVLPNAGDHILNFGDAAEEFKKKINNYKPFLLAVSSLGANKNFKGLSQAVSKTELGSYRMVIAGGVSKSLSIEKEETAVTYLGYVSDSELKYLYSQASLFIFPSFYEGFGIPPLEAMTMKCPVLASNTSSLPEVLGDACEYCNPFDVNDIAAKIKGLIDDTMKAEPLSQKGFLRSLNYRWKNSAIRFDELVKGLSGS